MAKHEAVRAADANVLLARDQGETGRLRHPPTLKQLRLRPRLVHDPRRAVERTRDDELALGLSFDFGFVLHFAFSFCLSSSITTSNSSKRASQSWRYFSIQSVTSCSRRGPSLQVRTRPTFSVTTSPACSKTPTCFFMPVSVMSNLPARSVIEASPRPSRSITPRRVASERAANDASSTFEY